MLGVFSLGLVLSAVKLVVAFPYDQSQIAFNLNQNQSATDPKDYWGQWDGHTYNPSPSNWRFPYYTAKLFLDRFVNGDPSNDDVNNTFFEHDPMQTQLRHGGDVQGLVDTLDYIQGIGIKGLYLAGSPFINLPWESDGYSPIDFTLLDAHFGTIQTWRNAITEIHRRGMYVILDNTLATMSDLIGFDGYLNTTTPFSTQGYEVTWKNSRHYSDFSFSNDYENLCQYPRLYDETGYPVGDDVTNQLVSCYDSDFDQYGDMEAFGVHPDWQRQLSKFASVQDRLREWSPSVLERIQRHACISIAMLDIDGFRLDKATQSTVDAQGNFSNYVRTCAEKLGKKNFMVVGEITGGNTFGSIYVGRGRLADTNMWPASLTDAISMNNETDDKFYIREPGHQALDAAAFHYSIYRSLTRFLGMDGNLEAGFDVPRNWVDAWNEMILTNDMVNPNPGGPNGFDPRHLYGVTNQDVFRWPAIANGTDRQLLGHFITTLHMPGSPLILWGEEQSFYVLDNTAENYIFGRQSMSSAQAWQLHGCYSLNSVQYYQWPLDKAKDGCNDNWNSLDHRDPSSPVRNILKSMLQMRENYPVLNDGFFLQQLSNQTDFVTLPGSTGVPTEFGLWSTLRSRFPATQDLSGTGQGNQSVWLVYHNINETTSFSFDCSNNDTNLNITALIAPFDSGTVVKNLFYPYDEQELISSARSLGLEGSTKPNGCLSQLTLPAWGFAAYVPKNKWQGPRPMVTGFVPGHDARILSNFPAGGNGSVDIAFHFSSDMDCDSITKSFSIESSTTANGNATLDSGSVQCGNTTVPGEPNYVGSLPTVWQWSATLNGVSEGVHRVTIANVSEASGNLTTGSTDHFLFRIGQVDNPIVFPLNASYGQNVLHQFRDGSLYATLNAPGADLFRYSLDWGSSYSGWQRYTTDRVALQSSNWTGTSTQAWTGDHVIMQYWSRLTGSSDHVQHSDLDPAQTSRRFPHLYWQGPYNEFGFDAGLDNEITLDSSDELWKKSWLSEWPDYAQVNVWGMNPDGQPDGTNVFGDSDGDAVLDRSLPNSLAQMSINITEGPPSPYLAWEFQLDDATYKFHLEPVGSRWLQLMLFILLALVPVMTAALAVFIFVKSFYQVKFNKFGLMEKKAAISRWAKSILPERKSKDVYAPPAINLALDPAGPSLFAEGNLPPIPQSNGAPVMRAKSKRRKVLIATLEYDISDWGAKVKIGGLGVMAQLMGKHLTHQDLIWVVPKVGDIEYKEATPAPPMKVKILEDEYEIEVQLHVLQNITYVLLDAPVFRKQMKAEPYPARMDDLESGVYYSAWNQAIAQAIERFSPDLYHINDYHGAVAPLYLLEKGQTIPVCLSLHNAEFQGLWPMRTPSECEEVCSVFNLPRAVVSKYVQFGEVFNLLHAGASYLRLHQEGFGAVGVSKKYGKRSFARYPIFWGLSEIGQLPNPDPSDTDDWDGKFATEDDIKVDEAFEAGRGELKRQAQEWAGLNQDPNAELMVFVGRWSMQKGVDLIADVFPSILEKNQKVQLICIGPVIDLYGRFAALKLARMMKLYPGRVFSKPEFTALPPYIFSGAEFALIPSRDEPFGLVAVEFGRKGALGIGARVGGLGQVCGWWYTVESTTTAHLLAQFRTAILEALASKPDVRANMRARSAKARFPVVQWVEGLEALQSTSVKLHKKVELKAIKSSERMSRYQIWRKSGVHDDGSRGSSRGTSPKRYSGSQTHDSIGYGSSNYRSKSSERKKHSSAGPEGRRSYGFTLSFQLGSKNMSLGMTVGPGHSGSNTPNERHSRVRSRSVSSFTSDRHTIRDSGMIPPVPRLERGLLGTSAFASANSSFIHEPDHNDNESVIIFRPNEVAISHQQAQEAVADDMERENAQTSVMPGPSTPHFSIPHSGPDSEPISALTSPRASTNFGTHRDTSQELIIPTDPLEGPSSAPYDRHEFNKSNRDLNLETIVGARTDFNLQKVDPFFNDSTGEYFEAFKGRLTDLNGKNSDGTLCIEEYLVKVEKHWFRKFKDAKLGLAAQASAPRMSSLNPRSFHNSRNQSRAHSPTNASSNFEQEQKSAAIFYEDPFLLGEDYKPPTGLRHWMQRRIGDWPLYSFFIAFGQIIAANSYQISLLSGTVGESAERLYIIASVYLATSIVWWGLFRLVKSIYVLSIPFFFYGLAFLLIGLAHFLPTVASRGMMQTIATVSYAAASSSGSIFFAVNFADEGGAPITSWLYRACMIQGTQSAYVIALWYFGAELTKETATGLASNTSYPITSVTNSWVLTAITIPICVVLWAVGLILFFGLPQYYRQAPGAVPSFYSSIFRRRIILWFFVAVALQNYWLSAPYGRNWAFLWSSQHAPVWAVVLLCIVFFGGVWAAFLWGFGRLSKDHSWILPLFAIGLGSPRWAQMLWGTSAVGKYLPWAGGPIASALVSRGLWLWLGVLDSLQGVGFGMILLQTLTRIHIAFTLIAAQVVGSVFTILARATAPDNIGPGTVFPDLSVDWRGGLSQPWFWVALICQGIVCIGFFLFFRREQLSKP